MKLMLCNVILAHLYLFHFQKVMLHITPPVLVSIPLRLTPTRGLTAASPASPASLP